MECDIWASIGLMIDCYSIGIQVAHYYSKIYSQITAVMPFAPLQSLS